MKKRIRQLLKLFAAIKPWQLLILTIVSTVVCIYALRQNNEHMNYLRNQVYSADKNGGDVQAALQNLAKYVTSNMNTSLDSGPNNVYPPIQLSYSYKRATAGQSQALNQQNSSLYTDAENYCQAQIPQGFSGRYRVPCIEQYVTSHSLAGVNTPASLYEFDFVSPTWSPDLAGWMMLMSILLAVLTLVSFVIHISYRRKTKLQSLTR
ncbi:MAG: hypothetical protein ACYCPS_01500 [Candidatus Saccharimonadales bacterium]